METYIDAEYEKIIEKLDGAKLFNTPVDLDNFRMVVVATYHMGRGEQLLSQQNYQEFRHDFDNFPVSKKSFVWKMKAWIKRVLLYKIKLYE